MSHRAGGAKKPDFYAKSDIDGFVIFNYGPVIVREMILCAGTQSSGSTLTSWCFLQRPDMDGVLDARFDHLPKMPEVRPNAIPWIKFTVSCFRFVDVQGHLEDEGYSVCPLLVVRDVRCVFNSLITKKYGRNGITADDPPIRLRLRRFLQDWQLFRERQWPMLRYEDLTLDPLGALHTVCRQMRLDWDDSMNSWPKPIDQIADCRYGNKTFRTDRGGTLIDSVKPSFSTACTHNIPPADLDWLEREFAGFNTAMGYPAHVPSTAPADPPRAIPRFENTRRYNRLRRRYPVSNFFQTAGRRVSEWMKHFERSPASSDPANAAPVAE
jgi:hypothetical protein